MLNKIIYRLSMLWVLITVICLGGCARLVGYEGVQRSQEEVAVIIGDPKINAGLPMAAVLRKVDDRVISWRVNTVEVLPGEHTVLVDCRMGSSTVRFNLSVNAVAGYRYHTEVTASPGNQSCLNVRLHESR